MSEEQQQEVVEIKTVTRDLVINSHASEVDIALLEDNTLVELHREKTNNQFAVGDVYLGRVKKILPGLNAAFVDVGYPKEAFLHYLDLGLQANSLIKYKKAVVGGDDVPMDKFKLDPDLPKNGKIGDLLNVGDLLPVQIAKEPIHTKGPRITAEVSFAGRYLVLVPFSNRISVSQKIRSSEERNRLRRLIQSIKPANYGVIIRTVAEGKKVADLDADLRSLISKWEQCIIEMKKMTTFGRMVSEMDQTSVMLRDLLNESFNNIHVNDEKLYEEIRKNISTFAPQKADIVHLYKGKEPIFDYFNVTKQIKGFFGKIVTIRNGVYLVIEHTEAMHVIDVNSGNRLKSSQTPEQNALNTNMIAAQEIARQLRLRDMGGIITIDFVDLHDSANKNTLNKAMAEFMRNDKAKHTILPLNKFGLIQITRQRVRQATIIENTEVCPTCKGTGKIKPPIVIEDEIANALDFLFDKQHEPKITVVAHPFVQAYLTKGFPSIRMKWSWRYKKHIRIVANQSSRLTEVHYLNEHGEDIILWNEPARD